MALNRTEMVEEMAAMLRNGTKQSDLTDALREAVQTASGSKTKKVVYNSCFGGFGVSKAGMERLIALGSAFAKEERETMARWKADVVELLFEIPMYLRFSIRNLGVVTFEHVHSHVRRVADDGLIAYWFGAGVAPCEVGLTDREECLRA